MPPGTLRCRVVVPNTARIAGRACGDAKATGSSQAPMRAERVREPIGSRDGCNLDPAGPRHN